MQYALLFHESQADFDKREHPEQSGPHWGAWGAYIQAIEAAGIIVSGAGLLPPQTGTNVRLRDGKREVHDGPYPESKEMLGGFFIIEVPNLDAALEWAARSPSASYGTTEVRPVMPPMPAA
jgi:hypothetical protein